MGLGAALELDEGQMRYLTQAYYDRNDRVFDATRDARDPLYQRRCALMDDLRREFLAKQHPIRLGRLGIRRDDVAHSFRHLFVLESLLYASSDSWQRSRPDGEPMRLASVGYASTLNRLMRLDGEVARKDIIRVLIILMAPFLTRKRLSDTLVELGFLPLSADHQLTVGGCLDALLLGLLAAYERECAGLGPQECLAWLRHHFATADGLLRQLGQQHLRVMSYRTIESLGPGDFAQPTSLPRPGNDYARYRIAWLQDMTDLRERHAKTPPGLGDPKALAQERARASALSKAWDETCHPHLTAPPLPVRQEQAVIRTQLLDSINRALSGPAHLVLLHGMGGVGKSVLARQYASLFAGAYDVVALLDCTRGLAEALCDDRALQVSGAMGDGTPDGTPVRSTRARAQRRLRSIAEAAGRQRCLFVLDNCDTPPERLYGRLFGLPADVIVTTRLRPKAWAQVLPESWQTIEVPSSGFADEREWWQFALALGTNDDWRSARAAGGGNILKTKLALMGHAPTGNILLHAGALRMSERQLLCLMALMPTAGVEQGTLMCIARGQQRQLEGLVAQGLIDVKPRRMAAHASARGARGPRGVPANRHPAAPVCDIARRPVLRGLGALLRAEPRPRALCARAPAGLSRATATVCGRL